MKIFLYFVLLLCVAGDQIDIRYGIKFKVARFGPNSETIVEDESSDVIRIYESAYYVQLDDEVPVLYKGIINIREKCDHFWAGAQGITIIEPGTFDNQNISDQLILSENLLTIIKKGTFTNFPVSTLSLRSNKIATVEEHAFENLQSLNSIDLSYNQLLRLEKNSIINTPVLESFILSNNKYRKIEENAFQYFKKNGSISIALDNNQITDIHPQAFSGISTFSALNLTQNNITIFPGNVFAEQKSDFIHIDLAVNQLKSLPEEFYKLKNVFRIDLKNNPLDCSTVQKLKPFQQNNGIQILEYNDTTDACILDIFGSYF